MRIIKSVATRRFVITLVESNNGLFYVKVDIKADTDHKSQISEGMKDLRVAFFTYDIKLAELEGH